MCTAVVGGSIHRAAKRIRAASDQRITTTTTSHRIKDRRKPVRSEVLGSAFGIAVTIQNNSLSGVAPVDDLARASTRKLARRELSALFRDRSVRAKLHGQINERANGHTCPPLRVHRLHVALPG